MTDDERQAAMFPIQSQRGAKPHPLRIPWDIAELAYSVYAAEYGRGQSLERLAERGGFGPNEMDMFLPDWRERCDTIAAVERENDKLAGLLTETCEKWRLHALAWGLHAAAKSIGYEIEARGNAGNAQREYERIQAALQERKAP